MVLFSELIRRDDGVLRQLLLDAGLSELAAQGEIDRFVFEVRHAVEAGKEYPVEGLGRFFAGANATIAFRYDPTTQSPIKTIVSQPVEDETEEEIPAVVTAAALPETEAEPAPAPIHEEVLAHEEQPVQPAAACEPSRQPTPSEEPHLTTSAKMNPAPYVKGLKSYGKPPKNTDAFSYVDRPRRGKVDSFLVIAILAALIALGAIGFGYYHDWQERRAEEASIEAIETLTSDAVEEPTDATTNE